MRDFLRARSVEFEERNIRHSPRARAELLALTGDLVVPTLAFGGGAVVGFEPGDLDGLLGGWPSASSSASSSSAALGRVAPGGVSPPGNSLEADQGGRVISPDGEDLADGLVGLLARISEELVYNAAKGESGFRLGMHDGLRFAEDAVVDLLRRCGRPAPGVSA